MPSSTYDMDQSQMRKTVHLILYSAHAYVCFSTFFPTYLWLMNRRAHLPTHTHTHEDLLHHMCWCQATAMHSAANGVRLMLVFMCSQLKRCN